MSKATPDNIKIVAKNRKVRHNFIIEETFEAGMVLLGTEVKSLREGQCSLAEGYVRPQRDELFLIEVSITPYSHGTHENHEERRQRKLLMHRREIDRLIAAVTQGGQTIVPLMIYFSNGRAKIQIALASRRRRWDKRDKKSQKQARRDVQRELSRGWWAASAYPHRDLYGGANSTNSHASGGRSTSPRSQRSSWFSRHSV